MVTLSDPARRNAQDPGTWRALADLGASLPEDVRGVLLQADGPSFSAGLDRRMFTPEGVPGEVSLAGLVALDDAALDHAIAGFQEAFTWWRRPGLVSVAAVQGHAIGAGFQLALACDVRVVADDVQLAMREPSLGLVPDLVGTWPLVRAVGYSRALEICLSGRSVGAEEAVATGLALGRSHPGALRADARALLDSLVVAPHGAATETKVLLLGAMSRDLDEQRAAERTAQIRRLRVLGAMLSGEAQASADQSD